MPRPRGFSFRILIVDDEPSILETSAAVLGSRGYEVHTASDGFQALAELSRSLPDLIISDLRMPNMSGFELLSVVRRRFPHVPVIAITGEYTGSAPAGLIADAFFTKGLYPPEQLFNKIADLIDQAPIRPHLAKLDKALFGCPGTNPAILWLRVRNACGHSRFRTNTPAKKYKKPNAYFALQRCDTCLT